ncbi:MAG TPA: ParB/RepB/Spo0J family partition protein [Thermoplasmata archaeon]|nr:ParB/RepB/Spo0J family partition protein [Thermoplasmata archaeon]
MATEAAQATVQPKTREEPEYVQAAISELERTEGRNIREVDASSTVELAASIKERGVLEPVLVTRTPKGLRLVAGFRRVAAAKSVGMKSVPARILELSELEVLESQLVENVQRKDLSPIEEAKGLKALLEASGLTQEAIGKKIGKSQSYVANRIRLVTLPATVQELVGTGKLEASHAEVLLKAPAEARSVVEQIAKEAAKSHASVRDLEHDLTWRVRDHMQAIAFQKKRSTSKFPKCPSCKKGATEETHEGLFNHGDWSRDHLWNPENGKTARQVEMEQRSGARARKKDGEIRKSNPPRDLSQPATLRAAVNPHSIVKKMLEQLGPDGIRQVVVDDQTGEEGEPAIVIYLTEKGEKSVVVPKHPLRIRPVRYSTGDQAQVAVRESRWRTGMNVYDASARKTTLAAFEAWSKKSLPPSKGKSVAPDPKLLEGKVDTVLARLEKTSNQVELLEGLRALESGGKNRPTVVAGIDTLLEINKE